MSAPIADRTAAGQDLIERYSYKERLCHWITGFAYIYCLSTGLAFYSPFLYWIAAVLGGGPTIRFWHPIVGLVFVAAAVWMHELWRRDMSMTTEDRKWLDRVKYYATNQDELVPPQWKYNAGQKQFYWAMFFGAIALVVTGVVMWFPELVADSIRWVRPMVVILHCIAALATIGAFLIHIYMGLFVVPGSLEAMVRGFVSRDWARTHHRLWYEKAAGKQRGGN